MVGGIIIIDEAKMTGITPAMLTLSGMNVLVPPIMRRPTTRLAYCTGTRRSPVVMKITPTTTASAMIVMATIETGLMELSFTRPEGRRETMLMKIRIDMPLPMPRAVISSPSHITAVAPAVSATTMSAACTTSRFGKAP